MNTSSLFEEFLSHSLFIIQYWGLCAWLGGTIPNTQKQQIQSPHAALVFQSVLTTPKLEDSCHLTC